MYIPEIIEVKDCFSNMEAEGLIRSWELPYENILTRRSAAIFFFEPVEGENNPEIEGKLAQFDNFSYRPNTEKLLSQLPYRVTFSLEEKEKNAALNVVES